MGLHMYILALPLSLLSFAAAQASPNSTVYSYEPTLRLPDYGSPCASLEIVDQQFANSYGKPAFVNYKPPAECADFTHVTAELSLSTFAFQYDRLMHLIKDGIEVWRPSTPEPVGHKVVSKEVKDLSTFTNLFKTEGLVEFSLDNIISGPNVGSYQAELTLKFYKAETPNLVDDTNWYYNSSSPPTGFSPIVANESNIYLQPANGKAPKLPRNVTRAVLNVFASGNSQEEFWYTQEFASKGPTRLVQVFVGGILAGVADPFPIVYTGGLNPGLWQPLLGLKSTDVPSYIIDISPFLPILWDHDTDIQIAVGDGFNDTQGILSNWIISASLLTWDAENTQGSGHIISTDHTNDGYPITVGGPNATQWDRQGGFYHYEVNNKANLSFINPSSNESIWQGLVSWSQTAEQENHLNASNTQEFARQYGSGRATLSRQPYNDSIASTKYERSHNYPLEVGLIELPKTYKLVSVNRSFDVNISHNGMPYWVTINEESTDWEGHYTAITDIYNQNYHRHAEAINGQVIEDTGA